MIKIPLNETVSFRVSSKEKRQIDQYINKLKCSYREYFMTLNNEYGIILVNGNESSEGEMIEKIRDIVRAGLDPVAIRSSPFWRKIFEEWTYADHRERKKKV